MDNIIVRVEHMDKKFEDIKVFEDFSMEVQQGEFLLITGKSGSGKSTLLNMIGLLDSPDAGTITLFGESKIKPLSKKAEKMLHDKIGYLFQNYALIDQMSVDENLKIVFDYKIKKEEKNKRIDHVLEKVHLAPFRYKKVYQCSGGEQQRIALARLMLKPCELILADEPTGSLDAVNKQDIMAILKELQSSGKTIVMVSHDVELFPLADRVVEL